MDLTQFQEIFIGTTGNPMSVSISLDNIYLRWKHAVNKNTNKSVRSLLIISDEFHYNEMRTLLNGLMPFN